MEATRGDTGAKNELCPPNRVPDTPLDWVRVTLNGLEADYLWSKEPALVQWLERSRLNPARGVRGRAGDPQIQRASARFTRSVRAALAKMRELLGGRSVLRSQS